MIKVRRIGHAVFETPDLERLTDYYVRVIGLLVAGREKDRTFLASKLGHLAVELRRGTNARCEKLSFEVAPATDLTDAARLLAGHGIKSERRSDSAPGISNLLAFADPKGTRIEIFSAWRSLGDGRDATGIAPFKLGHVAYFVPDVPAIVRFYGDVLGFRVSDWIGDYFAFMRCNSDHHTVNFIRDEATRMHHIAFELADWAQLKTACDFLARQEIDIAWGPLRHGPGHNISIYHRDPDDHICEFFVELDQMKDEELGYFEPRPWHRDRPQRPKVWQPGPESQIWGPPPTPEFRRGRQ